MVPFLKQQQQQKGLADRTLCYYFILHSEALESFLLPVYTPPPEVGGCPGIPRIPEFGALWFEARICHDWLSLKVISLGWAKEGWILYPREAWLICTTSQTYLDPLAPLSPPVQEIIDWDMNWLTADNSLPAVFLQDECDITIYSVIKHAVRIWSHRQIARL